MKGLRRLFKSRGSKAPKHYTLYSYIICILTIAISWCSWLASRLFKTPKDLIQNGLRESQKCEKSHWHHLFPPQNYNPAAWSGDAKNSPTAKSRGISTQRQNFSCFSLLLVPILLDSQRYCVYKQPPSFLAIFTSLDTIQVVTMDAAIICMVRLLASEYYGPWL